MALVRLRVTVLALLIVASAAGQSKSEKAEHDRSMSAAASAAATVALAQKELSKERDHSRELAGERGAQQEVIRRLQQQLEDAQRQATASSAESSDTANRAARTAASAANVADKTADTLKAQQAQSMRSMAGGTTAVAHLAIQTKSVKESIDTHTQEIVDAVKQSTADMKESNEHLRLVIEDKKLGIEKEKVTSNPLRSVRFWEILFGAVISLSTLAGARWSRQAKTVAEGAHSASIENGAAIKKVESNTNGLVAKAEQAAYQRGMRDARADKPDVYGS